MLKRFLKAEKQFRTVHSAYRNVDFRLVDSKPTDLANQKREIDLLSKIKRRSKEIEEVEKLKNELRPRTEAIFSLPDEELPLTVEDFDEDGNLKPLPSDDQKAELALGARRVLRTVFQLFNHHGNKIQNARPSPTAWKQNPEKSFQMRCSFWILFPGIALGACPKM